MLAMSAFVGVSEGGKGKAEGDGEMIGGGCVLADAALTVWLRTSLEGATGVLTTGPDWGLGDFWEDIFLVTFFVELTPVLLGLLARVDLRSRGEAESSCSSTETGWWSR